MKLEFYINEITYQGKEYHILMPSESLNSTYLGIATGLSLLFSNTQEFLKLSALFTIVAENKEYLTANFLSDVSNFDVIKGYRADDSYFTFAIDFLSNTISLKQLSRAMRLGALGEQVVLKSSKAFEGLRFVRSEFADGEVYFKKKYERDKQAREDYFKRERIAPRQRDDVFMLDILREEMKRGDARLQRNLLE